MSFGKRTYLLAAAAVVVGLAVFGWQRSDRKASVAHAPEQAGETEAVVDSPSEQGATTTSAGSLRSHAKAPSLSPAPAEASGLRPAALKKAQLSPEKEAFVVRTFTDLTRNAKAELRVRAEAATAPTGAAPPVPSLDEWMEDLRTDMRARLAEGLTEAEIERVLRAVGGNPLGLLAYELPRSTTRRDASDASPHP